MRRGSISSPIKPSPLSLPQNGRNSPRTSRPNSMLFLHPNSSTSNLESDPEKNQVPLKSINRARAGTITRRRSILNQLAEMQLLPHLVPQLHSPETVVYLHAHLHH